MEVTEERETTTLNRLNPLCEPGDVTSKYSAIYTSHFYVCHATGVRNRRKWKGFMHIVGGIIDLRSDKIHTFLNGSYLHNDNN